MRSLLPFSRRNGRGSLLKLSALARVLLSLFSILDSILGSSQGFLHR